MFFLGGDKFNCEEFQGAEDITRPSQTLEPNVTDLSIRKTRFHLKLPLGGLLCTAQSAIHATDVTEGCVLACKRCELFKQDT